MTKEPGWLQRKRQGLWHLRKGGLQQYRTWRRKETSAAERPLKAGPPKLPTVITSDLSVPVIAGFVSKPSREQYFETAFNSIYWQVDQAVVYLEGYDEIPTFLKKPGVRVIHSREREVAFESGRFIATGLVDQGILFPAHDGIIYPPDYVSRLLSHLALTEFKAVVGVEGIQFPSFPKSVQDGYFFGAEDKLETLAFASALTPSTMAFDIENIEIAFEQMAYSEEPELDLAAHFKANRVPTLVIPRPSKWLKVLTPVTTEDHDGTEAELLQRRHHLNSSFNETRPWGEQDFLTRAACLQNIQVLSSAQLLTLRLLGQANAQSDSLTETISTETFVELYGGVERWVEIYGDLETKHLIYSALIRHDIDKRITHNALKRLSKIALADAVVASRNIVDKRPRDISTLRLHAKLSAQYFLWEEAKQSYLTSVQLAGAQGDESTTRILSEYFKFLVRAEEYEKASFLTGQIENSRLVDPAVMVSLILVYLAQEKIGDAQLALTNICNASENVRSRALTTLIRELLDASLNSETIATGVISYEALESAGSSPDDLASLLKIATLIRDRTGALRAWNILRREFSTYLDRRREIGWFWDSNWQLESLGEATTGSRWFETRGAGAGDYAVHRAVASSSEAKPKYYDGPKVSVILTAFNAEATIGFAIQSIINQSHANLELIVVDDKSSDRTVKIVESWAERDTRITLVQNSTNVGPYVSRNVAISHSKGSFVAIQDADDVSHEERLKTQLDCFQNETKAVLGKHIRVDKDGVIGLENDGSILGHGPVTLMFRYEVLAEVGLFAEVRTRGDKEFESRLEHHYGSHAVIRLPEILVYALDDAHTNSKKEIGTLEKRRALLDFKQQYAREHARGEYGFQTTGFHS
jgi:hypothetical protein